MTWPPRLIGVEFKGGRPFREATWLPIDSLTVLLGANGAGKTTTLRILTQSLPALSAMQRDADGDRLETSCGFFVEVTDDQLGVLLEDAIILLKAGETGAFKGSDARWRPGEGFDVADGEDSVGRWVASVKAATAADPDVAGRVEHLRTSRIVKVAAETPSGPFHLSWCAAADGAGATRPEPLVALGLTTRRMLPTAVAVPRPLDEVREELRSAILEILVHLRWGEGDRWAKKHGAPELDPDARRDMRAWLADVTSPAVELSKDAGAVCALASRLADALTPVFVGEFHAPRVAIEPLYQWERRGPSLTLDLVTQTGACYSMAYAADGHKVWLQLAVLETIAILRRYLDILDFLLDAAVSKLPAAAAVSDAQTSAAVKYRDAVALLREFASSGDPPLDQFMALRESGHRLYLIDEPEQHLHPRVQRTAARWLVGSGTAGASQALVATHSPHYLRIPGRVTFAYLRAETPPTGRRGSTISPLTPEVLAASDEIAAEMGFDRGELLSSVAAFVFVEGRADKLFLEAFAGERLHHAGVALVPIHGAVDAEKKGIVDSELVLSWTAARLAILLDNLAEDEWVSLETDAVYREQARKAKKTELRAMARVILRALEVGRAITPLGIEGDDMFDLIDDCVIKDQFPKFPGHREARAAWEEANAKAPISWKTFYLQEYEITVEPPLFGEFGAEMAARGVSSPGLADLLDRICALTSSS